MSRHARTRWCIVVTANDNGNASVYGSYYDYERAHAISEKMAAKSSYYNAEDYEEGGEGFTVQVTQIEPFTSMKAFLEGS